MVASVGWAANLFSPTCSHSSLTWHQSEDEKKANACHLQGSPFQMPQTENWTNCCQFKDFPVLLRKESFDFFLGLWHALLLPRCKMPKKYGHQSPVGSDPVQTVPAGIRGDKCWIPPDFPFLCTPYWEYTNPSQKGKSPSMDFLVIFSIFNTDLFFLMLAEWAERSRSNIRMWNLNAHFLYLFRWLFIKKRTFPRLTSEQTISPPLTLIRAESKSLLILLLKKKSHDKIQGLTCNGIACPRIFKTCSLLKSKYCPGKTAPEGDSGILLWNRDKRNRGNLSSQAGGRKQEAAVMSRPSLHKLET